MTEICAQHAAGLEPVVISVVGELDISRESEIVNLVMTLDPAPETIVHVDMSEVTFVDSCGLNALLKTKAYLQERQCVLHLLNPQQQFLRVVDLLGLNESLLIDLTDRGNRPSLSTTARTQTPTESSGAMNVTRRAMRDRRVKPARFTNPS